MSHPAFRRIDHRPWPLPAGPWRWRQSWRDLLFAHWPVPAARIGDAQGLALEGPPPLLHFSRRLDVVVWPIEVVPAGPPAPDRDR